MILLRVGNQSSDVTDPGDEESKRLKEEVDEVSVLSEVEIITAAEEEVGANTKLKQMESVHPHLERRCEGYKLRKLKQLRYSTH